ncbi:MAG: peptide-binding protein [Victivallales bacterium]
MNRNVYLNIIATILLISVIVIGLAVVKSIDLMRDRAEQATKQLDSIQTRIGNLEKKISEGQVSSPVQSQQKGRDQKTDTAEAQPAKIANLQFYDPNAETGGRLITALASETKNMNYLINNESFVSAIWDYATDSLTDRNLEHIEIFEPKLAESWFLSEDKTTYTIKIRKGILWHDFTDPVTGKKWTDVEVKAQDFKFYVDVIKDEKTDCAASRTYYQDLEKVEVVSDYEFKVKWSKPYFLSESMTLGLNPLPRHLYHAYDGPFDGKKFNDDHERNRMVVGCGPYRFDRWDKGQRIVLKRWEKYYGRKYGIMPPLETIVFEIIPHPNTQFQSLTSGMIDRMGLTPEQWVNRTNTPEFDEKTGKLTKLKYPSRSYSYIGYNLTMPLFQDKTVRQALTHLVNRERILKEVYYGLGRIVSGPSFIDTPYYDKSIQPYPFSIEKAKELLNKSGWKDTDGDGILDKDGKKFEFTILGVSNHPLQERILPIVKEDMAKAGIVMNIRFVEWSVYTQRLENKSFEVCILGWGMGIEDDPYQLWHSSEAEKMGSSNHIGFKNKEADRIIEAIRPCFDLNKRIELCHEFHKLLHEEQPYTFLISPYTLLAQSCSYRNVRVFPGGVETKIMWCPKAEQKQVSGGQ